MFGLVFLLFLFRFVFERLDFLQDCREKEKPDVGYRRFDVLKESSGIFLFEAVLTVHMRSNKAERSWRKKHNHQELGEAEIISGCWEVTTDRTRRREFSQKQGVATWRLALHIGLYGLVATTKQCGATFAKRLIRVALIIFVHFLDCWLSFSFFSSLLLPQAATSIRIPSLLITLALLV